MRGPNLETPAMMTGLATSDANEVRRRRAPCPAFITNGDEEGEFDEDVGVGDR